MQHPRHLRIEDYTYDLPEERIARYPLAQRDASRLLVLKENGPEERLFSDLHGELPAGMLLVYNQTRVVHARLLFRKPTGGTIEVFCLEPDERYADVQTAMLQKGEVYWKCLVGGAAKWKQGMVLEMQHPGSALLLTAAITERQPGSFTILLRWNDATQSFAEVLQQLGRVPLPPYLHREAEAGDGSRYQTIFAKDEGSVAAPTAALHFTDTVLDKLKEKGIGTGHVTLHVGAGTFRPVKSPTMEEHDMHAEWIEVEAPLVRQLLEHLHIGIVAVGTTSMRTLESLYWIGRRLFLGQELPAQGVAVEQWEPYDAEGPDVTTADSLKALLQYMEALPGARLVARTRIIIAPGYIPKVVRALITNFHQPQSTLLLLVAALIGDDWRNVYAYAMEHGFRFLSYGDSSLLWSRHKARP